MKLRYLSVNRRDKVLQYWDEDMKLWISVPVYCCSEAEENAACNDPDADYDRM